MKNLSMYLLGVCVIGLCSFKAYTFATRSVKTIVIDAGHGGHDPGCIGANIIDEKTVTLNIALKLGKLIQDSLPNIKVIYTRNTDKFIPLWERPNIANKNSADLFISIHCNANTNITAAGSETYVMGMHKTDGNLEVSKRENEAILKEDDYKNNSNYAGFDPKSPVGHIIFSMIQNVFLDQSLKLASKVENEFHADGKINSRGVKQAGFLVLWKTTMPSVLIETGFLTNENDRNHLKTNDGQQKIAYNIFNAIKKYKSELESVSMINKSNDNGNVKK